MENQALKALQISCEKTQGLSRVLKFCYGEDLTKMIEITEVYKEIFPGVQMKAIFNETNNGKYFMLEAKAESKIDIYQALPEHFIYMAYGKHREPISGNVYKKGDEYRVHANQMSGADFSEDSQLLIYVPK